MTKPCCICGEEVKDLEQGCLDGAGHVEISFGYGSVHDTETWTGLIHDKCFKEVFKPKEMDDAINLLMPTIREAMKSY